MIERRRRNKVENKDIVAGGAIVVSTFFVERLEWNTVKSAGKLPSKFYHPLIRNGAVQNLFFIRSYATTRFKCDIVTHNWQ